jgi:hypothetical protein
MVIVISSEEDGHVPYVTKHLRHGYVLIDAGTILEGQGLTFAFDKQNLRLRLGDTWLEDVTGIWLRRPRMIRTQLKVSVSADHLDYCRSAIQGCLDQLYAFLPDAIWVSDRYAIERAENKVFQLCWARQVGFAVPDTTITSDTAMAQQFVNARPVSIVTLPWQTKVHIWNSTPAKYHRKTRSVTKA